MRMTSERDRICGLLDASAVHEHAVRAEVAHLVAALDGRDLGVLPRHFVLRDDHVGARVAADR